LVAFDQLKCATKSWNWTKCYFSPRWSAKTLGRVDYRSKNSLC